MQFQQQSFVPVGLVEGRCGRGGGCRCPATASVGRNAQPSSLIVEYARAKEGCWRGSLGLTVRRQKNRRIEANSSAAVKLGIGLLLPSMPGRWAELIHGKKSLGRSGAKV